MSPRGQNGAVPPHELTGWRAGSAAASGTLNDCCLIICTYRRAGETIQLLARLNNLRERPAEVLVVDGSGEPVVEEAVSRWMETHRPRFELTFVRSPKGLARQRNAGIDISTRELVFFLDDDSLPLEGYFTEIRKVFTADAAHRIGAAGGYITNEMNKTVPARWRLRLRLGLVPRGESMTYQDCGTGIPLGLMRPFQGIRPVDALEGKSCTFRREVFGAGKFSPFFYDSIYCEDTEMSLRVREKWDVVCCGDALIEHHSAPSGRPGSFRKGRMEVLNRYYVWKRYRSRASLLNRIRFYADPVYVAGLDLAWFLARPWRFHSLLHAAGLVSSLLECVLSPPRHVKPPVHREFSLREERPPLLAPAGGALAAVEVPQ